MESKIVSAETPQNRSCCRRVTQLANKVRVCVFGVGVCGVGAGALYQGAAPHDYSPHSIDTPTLNNHREPYANPPPPSSRSSQQKTTLTSLMEGRMHWECAHAIFSITIVMLPAPSTRLT